MAGALEIKRRERLARKKGLEAQRKRNEEARAANANARPEAIDRKLHRAASHNKLRVDPLPNKLDRLRGIPFASSQAEDLAREHKLTRAHFSGLVQSGKTGYTTGDVRALTEPDE